MTVAVLYHDGCPDGWTAAWVAHRALLAAGRSPRAIPVTHGNPPPDLADADEVYVVDFSYPHDTLVEMAKERRVTVLDHHRSAMDTLIRGMLQQPDLEPWPGSTYRIDGDVMPYEALFDMDRSGAGITWDYFHPGQPRPPLVNYVEDRDLWNKALPMSEAVTAFIGCQAHTLASWDTLADTPVADMAAGGVGALAHIAAYCASVARQAYVCEMGGRTFPIVNAPHECGSDVVNHLLDVFNADMAGYYFERADGLWQYGFRSRNGVTVHDFAQQFGGGGHPQASGCQVAAISHLRVGVGGQW